MRRILVIAMTTAFSAFSPSLAQNPAQRIKAPRFWNDKELSDWATPVVGVNVRPGHYSEAEYYAAPEMELVRTYPVCAPGKEPAGYWEMLQKSKPQPLLKRGRRTDAEWRSEGQRVFHELDAPVFRNYDPRVIDSFRSAEEFQKVNAPLLKDGTIPVVRWAPTSKGLAITIQDCASCHSHIMPDGSILDGAPLNISPKFNALALSLLSPERLAEILKVTWDTPAMATYRQFGVPGVKDDVNERLKTMAPEDQAKFGAPPNVVARFNGSPFYPTKVPDLIGIRDRKFIDHTATHQLRGISDVVRYAALESCCDIADFGSHRMLSEPGRRIIGRFSDDVLRAVPGHPFGLKLTKDDRSSLIAFLKTL